MREKKIDRVFLGIVLVLILAGAAMFVSASLGILARDPDIFYSVLRSQLILGFGFGIIGMYLALKINYKFWCKYSFYIFLGSIILTAAVFIPQFGVVHQGAERWIKLGPLSFQPVEFLKFGFVLYFAAWLSWAKNRAYYFKFSILPLFTMLAIIAVILFKQPDTKSFILITVTGFAMLFISGVPWKSILGLTISAAVVFSALVFFNPYLQERVKTFIDPSQDPQGASYQIQQSFRALGGGGIFGRGYGQSIQKFNYLPEPQGDSIFAIIGEELGFAGAVGTILLYLLFVMRGLRIANNSPDLFSRLFVSGIVILITAQSFMHIASVTGVLPLTGVPLVFVSHGGTSLMIDLMAIGIVFQISKFQHKAA